MSLADVNYLKGQKEYQKMAKHLLAIMEPLIRCSTPSGREVEVAERLLQFVNGRCPGWTAFSDRDGAEGIGNVLAVPTQYVDRSNRFASTKALPIIMAHMDTVDMNDREQLSAYTFSDSIDGHGIVGGDQDFVLGFDDRAGIALILYLMSTSRDPEFKVLFTVEEESTRHQDLRVDGRGGGGGIQYALTAYREYFDTSPWTIMVDRAEDRSEPVGRGSIRKTPSDIVYNYFHQDTCSPAFRGKIEAISQDLSTPMRSAESGAKGDTYNIYKHYRHGSRPYASVNLAAGGYREHKPGDYLCIYETIRTLRVVEECIRQQDDLYQASQAQ
ncbi:MAG TPA: hypothetical protein PLG75_06390 [Methanoculleus sp.]|nr:hypothetical protein [Methanoculleus sp.]